MAKTGSNTDYSRTFDGLFLAEEKALKQRDRSAQAKLAATAQGAILKALKEIGHREDVDLIVSTERQFLENELERYANSPAAVGSLTASLNELSVTEHLLRKVCDPEAYKAVDQAHSLPKNRRSDLPHDEARQFFRSHAARLLNLDKSRLTTEEKTIINQRKVNIRTAEKVYIGMQEQALGRPARSAGQGLGLGL